MESLEKMSLDRKRLILTDWLYQMDEDFLDELLIEYLDYDYLIDEE